MLCSMHVVEIKGFKKLPHSTFGKAKKCTHLSFKQLSWKVEQTPSVYDELVSSVKKMILCFNTFI